MTINKELFNLTTDTGYEFQLRIADIDDKLAVEFYDVKHNQFITRYYAESLLNRVSYGLSLQGGVPVWSIDHDSMEQVKHWLKWYIQTA